MVPRGRGVIPLDQIQADLSGPWLLCALAALGLAVGVLTGLFGVGGAFLITPLLNVALGIPYTMAIGSSLSFTIGSSSRPRSICGPDASSGSRPVFFIHSSRLLW